MNQALALRVLGDIMAWPDDRAREEFRWLRLMSKLKYDGYQDFVAGVRFIERLATWLQQFERPERQIAYEFIRRHLVYVGPAEMNRLVELLYPEEVQRTLARAVARRFGMPIYRVWVEPGGAEAFRLLRRKTLFMALSDGARIDILRRVNAGELSNEQVVAATQVDSEKWKDLLAELRNAVADPTARFAYVYVIDDFVGTGKTLIRYDVEKQEWKGKLKKFWDSCQQALRSIGGNGFFEDEWVLRVHHYIAGYRAASAVREAEQAARQGLGSANWFPRVEFSFGMILPQDLPVDSEKYPEFLALTDKYYDRSLENKHTEVGGVRDMRLGFGGCALPLVLDHNTPNNSISLLWADTEGGQGHPMRPLFRRRQRHA